MTNVTQGWTVIFYTNSVSFDKIPIKFWWIFDIVTSSKSKISWNRGWKGCIYKNPWFLQSSNAKQDSYWFSSHFHHFLTFLVGGLFPQGKYILPDTRGNRVEWCLRQLCMLGIFKSVFFELWKKKFSTK